MRLPKQLRPVDRSVTSAAVKRDVVPSDIACDLCYFACGQISDPVARAACYFACDQTVC
ncbi:MAG: hypothetical protein QOI05_607 [Bradyrhizobium sp.]|jgi:hypothetical protein|nr:hypothetical protein [Bradyrhizobium sp.]